MAGAEPAPNRMGFQACISSRQKLMGFSLRKPGLGFGQQRGGPRSVSGGPTDVTTIVTRDGEATFVATSNGSEISAAAKLAKCSWMKLRRAHCPARALSSSPHGSTGWFDFSDARSPVIAFMVVLDERPAWRAESIPALSRGIS